MGDELLDVVKVRWKMEIGSETLRSRPATSRVIGTHGTGGFHRGTPLAPRLFVKPRVKPHASTLAPVILLFFAFSKASRLS
jgi:hypothetical protein